MSKAQGSKSLSPNKKEKVRLVRSESGSEVTQQEAEAKLHVEGYDSFCWYDVPGSVYPTHRHRVDECIWMIKGEMEFRVGQDLYLLQAGDRLYLSAKTPHEAVAGETSGATYLVGQKKTD